VAHAFMPPPLLLVLLILLSIGNMMIKKLINYDFTGKSVTMRLWRILSSTYMRSLMTVCFEMKKP